MEKGRIKALVDRGGPGGPSGLDRSSGPQSDDLSGTYSVVAADSAVSEQKREAALLFSVAESHLVDEQYSEALSAAQDALEQFRRLGDHVGVADAQRVAVYAYKHLADVASMKEDLSGSRQRIAEARQTVGEELEAFKALGDKRGEASMLLALAEVTFDCKDEGALSVALTSAEEALDIFIELGEAKMQGIACLVLSKARFEDKQVVAAKRAGNDAISIFQGLGDTQREMMAWGNMANIYFMDFCYHEAIKCERKRLKLAVRLGDRRAQACALHMLAQWWLMRNDAPKSVTFATQALEAFRELPDGHEWHPMTVGLLADAHVVERQPQLAIEVLLAELDHYQEQGHKRAMCSLLYHLSLAHKADKNFAAAFEAANTALQICEEISAKRSMHRVLELIALIHAEDHNYEEAKWAAWQAVEVLKDSADFDHSELYCKAHIFTYAKICVSIDEFQAAVDACEEGLRIAREVGDRCLEGQAMLALAGAQAIRGNTAQALRTGEVAVELFREIGGNYRIDEAKTRQTLAEVHLALGDVSEALRSIKESELLLQNFGDQRRLVRMKSSRVRIHQEAGEFVEAVQVCMEALKIARAEEDRSDLIRTLLLTIEASEMHMEYIRTTGDESDLMTRRVIVSRCEKCVRYAKEAITLAVKARDRDAEATAYLWAAHCQLTMGKVGEAEAAAREANAILGELDDKVGQAQALMFLAQLHALTGENGKAENLVLDGLALIKANRDYARDEASRILASRMEEMLNELTGQKPAEKLQLAPLQPPEELGAEAAPEPAPSQQAQPYQAPDTRAVRSFIVSLVQSMIGSGEYEIDADTPLIESGVDSLSSVELRTQLQQEFRVNLPSAMMFNYPTITSMVGLIVDEMTNKKISWRR